MAVIMPTEPVDQAEACAIKARGYVARSVETEDDPTRAKSLARAAEFAARAVMTAWSAPIANPERLWAVLEDPIGSQLSSEMSLWLAEVRRELPSQSTLLLPGASPVIEAVLALRTEPPPAGWEPPRHERVGWAGLSDAERTVASEALAGATAWVPGCELWLFGSRAVGEARPESDFDFLLVVPDDVPDTFESVLPIAMGALWEVGQRQAVVINHQRMSVSSFENPDATDAPLVAEVRAKGFQVPPPSHE
jgi:hypothetical protein